VAAHGNRALETLAVVSMIAFVLLVLPQRVRPWATWSVRLLLSMVLWADLVY
jgi:hypothetical protein